MARKKPKKLQEDVESYFASMVYDEYTTAQSNQDGANADFEAVLDMIECRRSEKDYDWLSDYSFNELASILNTESAMWASRYFQTRDFCDIYLEGDKPEDLPKCKAYKKLLNKTLNLRDVHHYQKHLRGKLINSMKGEVWGVAGWAQNIYTEERVKQVQVPVMNELGQPMLDPMTGKIAVTVQEVPDPVEHILEDRFDYDVCDPRNVFTDNALVYSPQDKRFVIIRSERSYEWLKANEDKFGYINLDQVRELAGGDGETKTKQETYNKFDQHQEFRKTPVQMLDVLDRYGKVWAIVEERNELGVPIAIKPGIGVDGEPIEKAELVEAILTEVLAGSSRVLVRFVATPFFTVTGTPYRPLLRGACYIHPVSDVGMSDAKYARELQSLLDDFLNMAADRTKLSTMPTMQGRRSALEDNDQVYLEPGHIIPVDNPGDLTEFRLDGDIRGPMNMASLAKQQMQQVTSVYPVTMGQLPDKSNITATASAGAQGQGNLRSNYKDLTFSYTFEVDLYWMIGQMAHQFMQFKTANAVFGDDIKYFDPEGDYHFQPVSSNIEQEYNKTKKIQSYNQVLSVLQGFAPIFPQVMPAAATIIQRIFELMGDEVQTIAPVIKQLMNAKPQQQPGQGVNGMQDQPQPGGGGPVPSNQHGQEMSGQEMSVRGLQ